jgi:hypothetical protein
VRPKSAAFLLPALLLAASPLLVLVPAAAPAQAATTGTARSTGKTTRSAARPVRDTPPAEVSAHSADGTPERFQERFSQLAPARTTWGMVSDELRAVRDRATAPPEVWAAATPVARALLMERRLHAPNEGEQSIVDVYDYDFDDLRRAFGGGFTMPQGTFTERMALRDGPTRGIARIAVKAPHRPGGWRDAPVIGHRILVVTTVAGRLHWLDPERPGYARLHDDELGGKVEFVPTTVTPRFHRRPSEPGVGRWALTSPAAALRQFHQRPAGTQAEVWANTSHWIGVGLRASTYTLHQFGDRDGEATTLVMGTGPTAEFRSVQLTAEDLRAGNWRGFDRGWGTVFIRFTRPGGAG